MPYGRTFALLRELELYRDRGSLSAGFGITLPYHTGRECRMYLLLRPAEWGGKVLALSLMPNSISTS